jgi:hypothetical protein
MAVGLVPGLRHLHAAAGDARLLGDRQGHGTSTNTGGRAPAAEEEAGNPPRKPGRREDPQRNPPGHRSGPQRWELPSGDEQVFRVPRRGASCVMA